MTDQLREALAALKEAGVQRAALKMEGLELSVEFQLVLPDIPVGDVPVPGGWKAPARLDDPFDPEPVK